MTLNLPYPVHGRVYNTDGSTAVSGASVVLRNEDSNQLLTTSTNSSGDYELDAGNFSEGYNQTTKLTVYVLSSNLEASSTINVEDNTHKVNLTLSAIADSDLIYYTTVQNVFDELDDLTADDLEARRIIRVIQRAESDVENRTGMKFASTTVTQEVYDWNQYTTNASPEQLVYIHENTRNDYMNVANMDRLWLRNRPIVSITTLQRNNAGASSTDSWETLTENSGSGGDYVLTPDGKASGYVDFVQDKPRMGKRAARVTYIHGYATTPKNIERLVTLLSVKDIVLSKISRSMFDNPGNISLASIALGKSNVISDYMKLLNNEIDRLWVSIGNEFRVV